MVQFAVVRVVFVEGRLPILRLVFELDHDDAELVDAEVLHDLLVAEVLAEIGDYGPAESFHADRQSVAERAVPVEQDASQHHFTARSPSGEK